MEGNMEPCTRCGRITEYEIDTPTEARRYFVEGTGQLCPECWRKVYHKCTPDDELEDVPLMMSLKIH